jgi:glycerate kinase
MRQDRRVMRVLLAPDRFAGTLTAPQAAQALAQGWRLQAPDDTVELCPLSDGGPGFLDVLRTALPGRLDAVTVSGPLGEPVPAGLLVVDSPPDGGSGRTVYVESAQACGLHLVPADRRDPGATSTRGVGELLLAARDTGARRVVVGLGGSATNDAGAGLLGALAAQGAEGVGARLAAGGAALRGLEACDLGWLGEVRREWADVELVVASDVDIGLLGLHGASAGFAERKGATPEQAQGLERCLGDFAAAATSALGLPAKLTAAPGAGAAGGLGFGLLLLGAQRMPGTTAVTDAVRLDERLRRSDLVVTGEGCFDWQSLRGKVVAGVARAGIEVGTPVVVVAGQVLVGRREAQSIGVESAYPVARTPAEVAAALADPYGTLAARAQRVARTWSR